MASPYQSVKQRRLEEYERIRRANHYRLLAALVVASVAAVGMWQLLSSAQNTAAPESISVNDHDQNTGIETTADATVMALPTEPVDDNHHSYSEAAPSPISADNRPPEDTASTDKPTVRLSVLPNPMKLRRPTLLNETPASQQQTATAEIVVDDTAHDKLMGKGAVLLSTAAMTSSNVRRESENNRNQRSEAADNSRNRNNSTANAALGGQSRTTPPATNHHETNRNASRESENNRNQRSETADNSRNRNNSTANAASGGQSRTTPPATNHHEASRNRNASRESETDRNQRSEAADNSRNRNNASAATSAGNTVRTTPPAAHPRNPNREASNNRNQNSAAASNASRAEAILNNRNPDAAANNRAGSSGGPSRNATAAANNRTPNSTATNNASRAEAILNNRNPDAAANNRAGSSGGPSRNATAAANNRTPNSTATNNASRAEAILNNRASLNPESSNAPDPRALLEGGSRRRMIQVGVYGDEARARDVQRRLAGAGISAYVAAVEGSGGKQYRVRTGTYPNAAAAEQAMAKIKMQGLDGIFLDR